MHDDRVAIVEMKPRGVFEHDLFVDRLFGVRKIQALALQRIVKLLGAAKVARRSLNQMPVGFDACRIHHQSQRRQQLGDATAIERRTDVGDAHRAHPIGLRGYPLERRRADQRLVLFERMKPEGGSLYGGAQHGHRRVTFRVIALRQCGLALWVPFPTLGSCHFFPTAISPKACGSCLGLASDTAHSILLNNRSCAFRRNQSKAQPRRPLLGPSHSIMSPILRWSDPRMQPALPAVISSIGGRPGKFTWPWSCCNGVVSVRRQFP